MPFLVSVVLGNFVSCVSFSGVVSFIDFVYLITVILGFCCCMFGFVNLWWFVLGCRFCLLVLGGFCGILDFLYVLVRVGA